MGDLFFPLAFLLIASLSVLLAEADELDAQSADAIKELIEISCGNPCRVGSYKKAYDALNDDMRSIVHGCSDDKTDFEGLQKHVCEEGKGVELVQCIMKQGFEFLKNNPQHLPLFMSVHHTLHADLAKC